MNNFTDDPYTLKQDTHIAYFSVLTPERQKYVKPVDPVTTWHLPQDNLGNAAFYASSFIKPTKSEDFNENYWFPTPENTGYHQIDIPIQQRNLQQLENSVHTTTLSPDKVFSKFDWTESLLQLNEIRKDRRSPSQISQYIRSTPFLQRHEREIRGQLTSKDDFLNTARVCQH